MEISPTINIGSAIHDRLRHKHLFWFLNLLSIILHQSVRKKQVRLPINIFHFSKLSRGFLLQALSLPLAKRHSNRDSICWVEDASLTPSLGDRMQTQQQITLDISYRYNFDINVVMDRPWRPPMAYFSTFRGMLEAYQPNGMNHPLGSDAGLGNDQLIALLRQHFPRECDGILNQISHSFQLYAWFDQNDLEKYGIGYLMSAINQIALENRCHLEKAKDFIKEWIKRKAAQVLSKTEPRTALQIFNQEELDLYGRVYLERALESIWIENEETARKARTAPKQLPVGNSHDTIVKDRPVADVISIQQPNEAPVQQPDDGDSDLRVGDDQFEDDAASFKPFGHKRSRSNPECAVDEEQSVAGATPIQLPARVRRNSDVEEWVTSYNLAKILGLKKDLTPTHVDMSLSPHSHIVHHASPQRSEGLNEVLHRRNQRPRQFLDTIRDMETVEMEPYKRSSCLTITPSEFRHEVTTWTRLPDYIKVDVVTDIYPNNAINTNIDRIPSVSSVRRQERVPRRFRDTPEGRSIQSHQAPAPEVQRLALADNSHTISHVDQQPPADNAKTEREPARNIIVPAVPDMHKLHQLLMKQKQAEESNIGVNNAQEAMASGEYDEARDSPPVSQDAGPSHATTVSKSQEGTISQTDRPAVRAPKELGQPDLAARKSSAGQTSSPAETRSPPLRTNLEVQSTDNSTDDPAKTAISSSNTFSQLQDFMNEDPAAVPSSESKILTSRSPSPEYSTPSDNSPSKQVTDNVDDLLPQGIAEPTFSSQPKTSRHSQGDDDDHQDNLPPTTDQRHESPSGIIVADSTAQSTQQIPPMHDSADPAPQAAKDGSVPAGDGSGQTVVQDTTSLNDSGMTGQPGEQDVTRDDTPDIAGQPVEQVVTQDVTRIDTSDIAGQPVEQVVTQDATRDNTSDIAGQPVEQVVMQDNVPAAVASKAAKNKKKNLKRKEKKEREKREADQELNSESDIIASSSTAYGTRALFYRSERPFDSQPGQANNLPASSSLNQMAHEYYGTFDHSRTIETQVRSSPSSASTAGDRAKASKRRAVLSSYEDIQDTISQLCAQANLDAGQVAKDMVAEKKKQFEKGPASPANVKALGLLQTELDAYLTKPVGIKFRGTEVETEFTHSLIDYLRKWAEKKDVQSRRKTNLAREPTSDLPPLYSILFSALPPADSTTPPPVLSKLTNNTIDIANPDKPGEYMPATYNVKDTSNASSSATVTKAYTVQPGDVVHFSIVDGSVTAVLRAEKYVYRCGPVCKRDANIKQRLEQETSPEIAAVFWDNMVINMTHTWTEEGIDVALLREYIAPGMQGMQRGLWEQATMLEQSALLNLEEVSGLTERPFQEMDPRSNVPSELRGGSEEEGVGTWLKDRRQGEQVKIPENKDDE